MKVKNWLDFKGKDVVITFQNGRKLKARIEADDRYNYIAVVLHNDKDLAGGAGNEFAKKYTSYSYGYATSGEACSVYSHFKGRTFKISNIKILK